jgi:signal transduction histidine kinase
MLLRQLRSVTTGYKRKPGNGQHPCRGGGYVGRRTDHLDWVRYLTKVGAFQAWPTIQKQGGCWMERSSFSGGQTLVSPSGELGFIGTRMGLTDLKRAEAMQFAVARERKLARRWCATDLAKANEVLRSCIDALASVPELDQFVGQVMAVITGQLGAASSALAAFNCEQKTMQLELLFQNGRVISPVKADYPERFRLVRLNDEQLRVISNEPFALIHLTDPDASVIRNGLRDYFLRQGVGTLLIVPLIARGEVNKFLSFRFAEKRYCELENVEVARALATQASLAIQLAQLAKTAKRSAVLEERNRLAGEIHDSIAQSFSGICIHLAVAAEETLENGKEVLSYIERARDLAKFGLSEARRSALSLRSNIIEESGLIGALKMLVERSNIPGRLFCTFRSIRVREEMLAPQIQQGLLRIAQEAIRNAMRHGQPTIIRVSVRWDSPNLVLKISDNGRGISSSRTAASSVESLNKKEGFGLTNMRTRAKSFGAELDIQSAPGHGTSIVVRLPLG